jgi:hypothetical protein
VHILSPYRKADGYTKYIDVTEGVNTYECPLSREESQIYCGHSFSLLTPLKLENPLGLRILDQFG